MRNFCVWYVCWVDYIPDGRWHYLQHIPLLYRLYKWAERHQ